MARQKMNPLDRWAAFRDLRAAVFDVEPDLATWNGRRVETRDTLGPRRKTDDADLQSSDPFVRFEAQARRQQLVRDELAHEADGKAFKKAMETAKERTVALMKAETDEPHQAAAEALLALLAPVVEANERLAEIDRLRERFIGSVWGGDALALPTLTRDVASLRERLAARRARRIA